MMVPETTKLSSTGRVLLRGVGVVLFVGLLLLGVVSYFNYTPPSGVASVTTIANRSDMYALVLRLPPESGEQDDILLYTDDATTETADMSRRVVRVPAGQSPAPGAAALQLAPEQWQDFETLRQVWCFSPPFFLGTAEGKPGYDVALRCDLTVRRVRVPADELPPELALLLEMVPPDREAEPEQESNV
jgi:hypothetical protein